MLIPVHLLEIIVLVVSYNYHNIVSGTCLLSSTSILNHTTLGAAYICYVEWSSVKYTNQCLSSLWYQTEVIISFHFSSPMIMSTHDWSSSWTLSQFCCPHFPSRPISGPISSDVLSYNFLYVLVITLQDFFRHGFLNYLTVKNFQNSKNSGRSSFRYLSLKIEMYIYLYHPTIAKFQNGLKQMII